MRHLKLIGRYLAVAVICFSFDRTAMADDAAYLSTESIQTIVLLLSQNVRTFSKDAMEEHLVKWDSGSVRYKILSPQPAPLINDAIAGIQQILDDAHSGMTLSSVDAIDDADIIVVHDERSSLMFSRYNVDLEKFYSYGDEHADKKVVENVVALFKSDVNPCAWFTAHDGYKQRRSAIFVTNDRPAFKIQRCINNALVSTLGLTTEAVSGNSIKAKGLPYYEPTLEDKMALKILYQREIQPGDTIGEAIKRFGKFEVNFDQ